MSWRTRALDERTQTTDNGDHERLSHYVPKDKLMEAMVNGTPVVALCGKVWIPSRDPQKFPVCPECKEIWDGMREGDERVRRLQRAGVSWWPSRSLGLPLAVGGPASAAPVGAPAAAGGCPRALPDPACRPRGCTVTTRRAQVARSTPTPTRSPQADLDALPAEETRKGVRRP